VNLTAELRQHAHNDCPAKSQSINLPCIAAWGFDEGGVGEFPPPRQPVGRRPRRHEERGGLCGSRAERYRSRAVEPLRADKEWPLVGGDTEEVRLERKPSRDVGGGKMRHAVAQVAWVIDEDPHRPATKCDATNGRSIDVPAPRRWTACACDSREMQRTHELGRLRRSLFASALRGGFPAAEAAYQDEGQEREQDDASEHLS
jgi:hypothetical protein